MTDNNAVDNEKRNATETGETSLFATFTVEDLYFGVDVDLVQEVSRHQTMTPVPLANRVIRGELPESTARRAILPFVAERVLQLDPREESRAILQVHLI